MRGPRFGLRGHDLGRMEAGRLADAVLEAGFDSLQLAPRKALLDFEGAEVLDRARARTSGRIFAGRGVKIAVLGCYVEVLHPDREFRGRELARLRESIEVCGDFGAQIVATETGRPSPALAGLGRGLTQELVDGLGELCLLAGRLGVVLAIEPVWDHALSGGAEARRLLDALPLPGLGFLLDPVNLVPARGLELPATPALEAIGLLGDRIVAAHAKDFDILDGERRVVACGQGRMEWTAILGKLVALKPDIDIIIEDQRPGTHAASRAWLESCLGS